MLQTIAKQLGDVQSRCFGAWRGVVASEKKEREAKLQKAARMWKHRGVGAAFRRWQDYRELRRFLRRVMSRAVMGKDARAKKDAYGELREHWRAAKEAEADARLAARDANVAAAEAGGARAEESLSAVRKRLDATARQLADAKAKAEFLADAKSIGAFRAQLLRKADRMGARHVSYDHQRGEWTIEVANW